MTPFSMLRFGLLCLCMIAGAIFAHSTRQVPVVVWTQNSKQAVVDRTQNAQTGEHQLVVRLTDQGQPTIQSVLLDSELRCNAPDDLQFIVHNERMAIVGDRYRDSVIHALTLSPNLSIERTWTCLNPAPSPANGLIAFRNPVQQTIPATHSAVVCLLNVARKAEPTIVYPSKSETPQTLDDQVAVLSPFVWNQTGTKFVFLAKWTDSDRYRLVLVDASRALIGGLLADASIPEAGDELLVQTTVTPLTLQQLNAGTAKPDRHGRVKIAVEKMQWKSPNEIQIDLRAGEEWGLTTATLAVGGRP